MSYDIYLNDPVTGEVIEFDAPHDMRGGTYAVGGTTEAWLNITYNYSKYYYESFGEKGIRTIYGMVGADSIPIIEGAIAKIETKYKDNDGWKDSEREYEFYVDSAGQKHDISELFGKGMGYTKVSEIVSEGDTTDYWEPTAANAIRPLYQLIAIAKMRPDGVWDGD